MATGVTHQNSVVQDSGYDVEVTSVEPVDRKYVCPVCLFVMRDAMQTACGHRFCKSCITRVAGDRPWGRCPVDKTVLRKSEELFNDIAMRREILSLKVKCKNSSEECLWTGELRDLENHQKECPVEKVQCPVGCEQMLLRRQISKHLEECPQRLVPCAHCRENIVFIKIQKHEVVDCAKFPTPCTLCGQTGIARGEISDHLDSITGSCPQAHIICKFRPVGCHFQDKRRDMQKHYESNVESHVSLLMGRVAELALTNDILRDELYAAKSKLNETSLNVIEHTQMIQQLKDRTVNGRLLWKLDLSSMQPLPNMVFSPPFYSSCPGYQMRLRLDFRGVCDGEDIYSSVFLILQKGEFDQDLIFPFNGRVKVTLIAQGDGRSFVNVSTIINCKDIPRNMSGNTNARINSRGHTRFIKKTELLSPVYNKNNVLFFDVSIVSQCETLGNSNGSPLTPV